MENSHDVFTASPLLLVSDFLSPSSSSFLQHSHVGEPAGIFQDAGWEDWEGEEACLTLKEMEWIRGYEHCHSGKELSRAEGEELASCSSSASAALLIEVTDSYVI